MVFFLVKGDISRFKRITVGSSQQSSLSASDWLLSCRSFFHRSARQVDSDWYLQVPFRKAVPRVWLRQAFQNVSIDSEKHFETLWLWKPKFKLWMVLYDVFLKEIATCFVLTFSIVILVVASFSGETHFKLFQILCAKSLDKRFQIL